MMYKRKPKGGIPLKKYSLGQLVKEYDYPSHYVLKKHIRHFAPGVGQRVGLYYSKEQVLLIFEALGWPGEIIKYKTRKEILASQVRKE